MFPCGHMHYSTQAMTDGPALQVLGSILPDAATTSAFSWTELHQAERVADFAAFVSGDASLEPLINGLQHHIELDARSHDAWQGRSGYAYDVQTEELRHLVHKAFGAGPERALGIAHNFIEAACDIHIAGATNVHECLGEASGPAVVNAASSALAGWLAVDEQQLRDRINQFLEPWRQPYATVDDMTAIWLTLVPHLNASTFNDEITDVDADALRAGLDLALTLTADSYQDVLNPR